tara:strand:- start:213735 stop:214121 length:387 start_codon:yes stop_codon:yes gene_type:complete
MQITQWREFSQEDVFRSQSCFKYFVYYEAESLHAEQDVILLNNICGALAWDKSEISFKGVNSSFDVSELNTSGIVLWFGFQTATRLGLIQNSDIQQVGNIIFCPSPQSIQKDVALKRQVWEKLKPLKN